MKQRRVLIFLMAFCGIVSCKKAGNSNAEPETFFKQYNVQVFNLANSSTTFATIESTGPIINDAAGNNYCWYNDKVISSDNKIAILKTDKNGKLVWNNSYFPFRPCYYNYSTQVNNYTWNNFICIGQTLYLAGKDSMQNTHIYKFNCSDGQFIGQMPIDLKPADATVYFVTGIWPTRGGNIVVNSWAFYPAGYIKPLLAMMSPDGSVLWKKDDFPFKIINPQKDKEIGYHVTELNDGSFIYSTIGTHRTDISSSLTVKFRTINFYHMSSSGSLLRTDSLPGGALNKNDELYDCNGEAELVYLFQSVPGEYLIPVVETYDVYQNSHIKILRTDASFHVLDSVYFNYSNSVLSTIKQKSDGSLMASVFYQLLPVQNYLCDLYNIAPDASISKIRQLGLSDQSVFVSGLAQTADGHMVMTGLIQNYRSDTNSLFILKTDNDGNY